MYTAKYRFLALFIIICTAFFGALDAVAATPDGDLVGAAQTYVVEKGDTVASIARHFDIGAVELLAANPAMSKPAAGDILTIPQIHVLPDAPHSGIVINLAELRLFYYNVDGSITTFPISIGREG